MTGLSKGQKKSDKKYNLRKFRPIWGGTFLFPFL